MDNLIPPAVVQAEIHLHVVVLRAAFRIVAERLQLRAETGQVAKKAEFYPVLFHVPQRLFQIPAQQLHDSRHFFRRALPVLRGKGVHRQVFHAQGAAVVGDPPEGFRACGVTGGAGQTPLLCPAAVAVHDDGNMPGRGRVLRKCHKAPLSKWLVNRSAKIKKQFLLAAASSRQQGRFVLADGVKSPSVPFPWRQERCRRA